MTEFEFNVRQLCLGLSKGRLQKLTQHRNDRDLWTSGFTDEEIQAALDAYDLPEYEEVREILIKEAK